MDYLHTPRFTCMYGTLFTSCEPSPRPAAPLAHPPKNRQGPCAERPIVSAIDALRAVLLQLRPHPHHDRRVRRILRPCRASPQTHFSLHRVPAWALPRRYHVSLDDGIDPGVPVSYTHLEDAVPMGAPSQAQARDSPQIEMGGSARTATARRRPDPGPR